MRNKSTLHPATRRFTQPDVQLLRLQGLIPIADRVWALLEAQEFVLSGIRGRLHRLHPELSPAEINMLALAEVSPYER